MLKYQLTVSPDVAATAATAATAAAAAADAATAAAAAAAAAAYDDVAKHQVDREISPLAPRTKKFTKCNFHENVADVAKSVSAASAA